MNYKTFRIFYYLASFLFFAYLFLRLQGVLEIEMIYSLLIIGIYLLIIIIYVYLKAKNLKGNDKNDNRGENKEI